MTQSQFLSVSFLASTLLLAACGSESPPSKAPGSHNGLDGGGFDNPERSDASIIIITDASTETGGSDAGVDGSTPNNPADGGGSSNIIGDGPDSDGDGISDSAEADYGTDPNNPDSDGDGLSDGDEVLNGTDPNDADSDDDGFSDGTEAFLGTDAKSGMNNGCANREVAAAETKRPVDVIVIVDNSSSMNGEITAVQDRINQDFGDILNTAGVDWRVNLLSRHGALDHDVNSCDDNGICIQGDLAGTTGCDPNAAPADTDQFKHYSICINSEDGLRKTAASFDESPPGWAGSFQPSIYFDASNNDVMLNTAPTGWHTWMRPDALRTFLIITDDKSNAPAADFVTWMYSKDPSYFGTAAEPNWVFHSIIAVEAKMTPTEPWYSTDPVLNNDCGAGSEEIGYDYQDLSIQSGGLRFPICENGNFNAVFQAIAQSVVEASQVPCTLSPQPVEGAGAPDYSRTAVLYEPGNGSPQALFPVADEAGCADGDYYIDDDKQLQLCPTICTTVSEDPGAHIKLVVACAPVCGNGEVEVGEECDDGNTSGGDTCSPMCTTTNLCGNDTEDPGEECDDGNLSDGDGCNAGCEIEDGCGDGVKDTSLDSNEECDDDNLIDGDGCSSTCQVEDGGCGDGKIQAGEQCDDDNTIAGDGCSPTCRYELI